jgi:hypothetical protein
MPPALPCLFGLMVGVKSLLHSRNLDFALVNGRLHVSYRETAFEEVIEANRCGTWTINASALPDARSR